MLGFLFQRTTNQRKNAEALAVLYADIVREARFEPAFAQFGVVDDFEGRFEMLTLITTLVLYRLRHLPAPAGQVAQDLVDRLFKDLDDGLRRMGIGDLAVPKKMKVLGQSFYGRADAYTAAFDAAQDDALRVALSRNLYGQQRAPEAIDADWIARLKALRQALDTLSLDPLLQGGGWLVPHDTIAPITKKT